MAGRPNASGASRKSNGSSPAQPSSDARGTPWLYIVPPGEGAIEAYKSWLPGRARRPFVMPEHAVIVGVKDPANPEDVGTLVAACGLFPTKGLFLMVEQCATNPEAPARVRHAAVEFLFSAVRIYAAITGKLPFFITNKMGLYKLAKKHGWVPHERAAVLECDPLHPVVPLNRREPHATKREALSTSSPERKRGRSSGGIRQRADG